MDKYQEKARDMALSGHNLVILGQAGAGKSYLLNRIYDSLLSSGRKVALTAMTGIASTHLMCANTIHYWAGFEDGRYSVNEYIQLLKSDEHFTEAKSRIQTTDTLIIDEVSMMSEKMLTKLELACRRLRSEKHFFGGIQVILCGDIFQLPPVPHELYGDRGKYFFQCPFFQQVFPHTISLKAIHRQDDPFFINVINETEKGGDFLSEKSISFLHSLNWPFPQEENAAHLFATNLDADIYNNFQLNKTPGDIFTFTSTDIGDKHYLNQILVPKNLSVKIGCKVMLLINLSSELVNGLMGFISEINENRLFVNFQNDDKTNSVCISSHTFTKYDPVTRKVLAQRKQIPLKLAYGITIHKSQGMTLDSAVINCKGVNKPGQLGVAIGRVTNSSKLKLVNFNKSCIKKHSNVVYEFYANLSENCDACCCQQINYVESCEKEDCDIQETSQKSTQDEFYDEDEDGDNFSDIEENVLDIIDEFPEVDTSGFNQAFLGLSRVCKEYKETPYEQQATNLQNMLTQHKNMYQDWYNHQFDEINNLFLSVIPNQPCKVQPKHFRNLYTSLNILLSSELFKDTVHTLMGNLQITPNDFNFQFFVSLMLDLQQNMLKTLSENVTCDPLLPLKEIEDENISGSGRGKIRYIGGFTVAKIMHSLSCSIRSCLYNFSRQQELQEHIISMKILEKMSASEIQLEDTNDPESLLETEARQNIRRSLTNISDEAFFFFQKLELKCRNFLSHSNLAKHKGDMFFYLIDYISKNKEITQTFTDIFKVELYDSDQLTFQKHDSFVSEIVNLLVINAHCIAVIKNRICELFCRVCISQFRKDYIKFVKAKKNKALRQRIMQKPSNVSQKVDITSVINDNSEGKVVSHFLLKAEISKNSQFLQGKLFTKSSLIKLGEFYGINVSKYLSKNEIAAKVTDVILESENMCCQKESSQTPEDPMPSTSQQQIEPLESEPCTSKCKGQKGTKVKKRKHNPDEYCSKCEKRYKKGQECICCDLCDSWYDRTCAGLDDECVWNFYADNDHQYICPLCKPN